jgi:sialate O-acetylesterase
MTSPGMSTWRSGLFAAILAIAAAPRDAQAGVTVAPTIGDHMVVQRGRPVRLGGGDLPGQTIRATLGAGHAATQADAAGRWSLTLPAPPAGGPFTLTIEGSTAATFTDVWSGEVWVASGQSNMELPLRRSLGAAEAVAGGCPGLRLFVVGQRTAAAPAATVEGRWQPCDAATAAGFSAVAFHFGRDLHRALGVPVGLILSARGGTPAEAWTPREALVAEPGLKPIVDAFETATHDPARRAELERARVAWEARNFHQDTGNRGEARGFARPRGGGAAWAAIDLPQVWESAGLPIDGAVWFRREVTLPPDWAGRDLALSLGALDDFDVTYWNGERVGATGAETPSYWSAPRRYTVPGRLARAGKNLIAVRVFDHYGSGGFAGAPAELTVGPAGAATAATATATATATTPLPLAGRWSYKIERRLKPAIADFSSRPRVPDSDDPESPAVLWNAMIAPMARLPIAGVIWYQGESNVSRAAQYRTLFPAMVRAWRAGWGDPALPFLFVQLPNFDDGHPGQPLGDSAWAELREAQALTLSEPRTAMAVTLDVGEGDNLHPRNKQEVGRRLALGALKLVYGKEAIASGPTFLSVAREGPAMRVRFAAIASGLDTSDGAPPRGFLIAGADHAWHTAAARIAGDAVIVSSPDVVAPVAVRYGWGNDPPNTLRNQADLPAAPFRTDDWPAVTGTATAAAR